MFVPSHDADVFFAGHNDHSLWEQLPFPDGHQARANDWSVTLGKHCCWGDTGCSSHWCQAQGTFLSLWLPAGTQQLLQHQVGVGLFFPLPFVESREMIMKWASLLKSCQLLMLFFSYSSASYFTTYDIISYHSIRSFKTIIPASAKDVYYRDEIGNISTSHMRIQDDAVELDLRPRFPLFGGWKTHYKIGYNVPSYEYLYSSGKLLRLALLLYLFKWSRRQWKFLTSKSR